VETKDKDTDSGQSGGVNVTGTIGVVHGDVVGRDKIIGSFTRSLDRDFEPLAVVIRSMPDEKRGEAEARLTALKAELDKGERANDGLIARLARDLVDAVPEVASALISAFSTPVLGSIVGAATKAVINGLRGK
jgi:hypothetical protein